jgi:hypothetical protein
VTETGLLIAQGVVILLLYLLVWGIVRSSGRELREADEAYLAPVPTPRAREDRVVVEEPPAPPVATLPTVAAVPAPAPIPVPEPEPAAPAVEDIPAEVIAAAAAPVETAAGARRERTTPAIDLTANIHPRIVVEGSPGMEPGTEFPLTSGMTIGRGAQNGISVGDAFVSHMHARIFRRGQFLHIEDLGSTNGTYVNDRRIEGEAQLRVRDEIRMGETILRYEE